MLFTVWMPTTVELRTLEESYMISFCQGVLIGRLDIRSYG